MANPKAVLQTVLAGGSVERTLLAPLVCAVAGEVEGLAPQAFLRNATKLANTLRDLQRGLDLDIVVPESGTHIKLEALGVGLDWSCFPPRLTAQLRTGSLPTDLERRGRMPILLDTVTRLSPMLGGRAAIGIGLSGPQRLVTATEGRLSLSAAAELVLATVRLICAGGVDLIWILEDGANPPQDMSEWLSATTPIWGTIRFHQAVPALHLSGGADGWLAAVKELGETVVPCIDPVQAQVLANTARKIGLYGAVTSPVSRGISPDLREFVRGPGCLLLTSDTDWFGRVPARNLGSEIELLRQLLTAVN